MEPQASTEHNDNQYIWQHFAATALQAVVARGSQPSEWQAQVAGSIADAMVKEYRKRWPWQSPYNGGRYGEGVQHDPNSLAMGTITAMDLDKAKAAIDDGQGASVLVDIHPSVIRALGVRVPDIDGNGHSVEATWGDDDLPRGSDGFGTITGQRATQVVLDDPMEPEPVSLAEPVAEPDPADSFIANGCEYRRNAHGSYEAYRTVDPEESSKLAEDWATQRTRQMEAERLAERIDHRISGDRSDV